MADIELAINGTYQIYTGLSTDIKITSGINVGALCIESDTGNKYEFNGLSWDQIGTGGIPGSVVYATNRSGNAEAIRVSQTSGFVPSSYTGKITSVDAGVSGAIATGAAKLLLQSLEGTSMAEFAVLSFGVSSADAISNLTIVANASTTGITLMSGDTTTGGSASTNIVGIPANATHYALGNGVAGADQVIMVTQGV